MESWIPTLKISPPERSLKMPSEGLSYSSDKECVGDKNKKETDKIAAIICLDPILRDVDIFILSPEYLYVYVYD
jgi:hypothetical protein